MVFGDLIDWSSPLEEALLYVELPFWLMSPAGAVDVEWSGTTFAVNICPAWMEVFGGLVLDSRASMAYHGPWTPTGWEPPKELAAISEQTKNALLRRPCKTVIRLTARAHSSAFQDLKDDAPPGVRVQQQAYWASLCEAHIPVVNELIQRYRLLTYDYFAYEISAWDVPVWYLKHANNGYRATLLPYKQWDTKPAVRETAGTPENPLAVKNFEWAAPDGLAAASSSDATPGEFDLLDARSLMERGDYTGAVRRTVTANEAVLRWALVSQLIKKHSPEEAESLAARTDNDFPGRLRQWRKLTNAPISQQEVDEIESTRKIRHDIVHRGRRLTHEDRGRAQRAVDTGRWLFNKIEGNPERARLRDYGVLKSVGRVALAQRFPSTVDSEGITLRPLL